MVQISRTITGILKRDHVESLVDNILNTKYRHVIKKKADELEKLFLKKEEIPRKIIIQQEMTYMKEQWNKNRLDINITYPVNPPFAFVNVRFDRRRGEVLYIVREPSLKEGEDSIISTIREKMESIMDEGSIPLGGEKILGESVELKNYLRNRFDEVIDLYDIPVDEKRKHVILYYLQRELIGFGRVDPIIRDPFIEDISCNGVDIPIYVYHRVFSSMKTNIVYTSELELDKFIFKLAQISGKHISIYQPIMDAVLSDGSRVNLTLGSEVTRKGSTFSIRKFSYDPISPIDLMRFSTISPLQLAYLWILIEYKKSILISGGTASGKTTLLNALCMFIRPEDKIVSIEDTPEIHIDHENWIQSVARTGFGVSGLSGVSGVSGVTALGSRPGDVNLYDLLVAGLRQRPEYVIVGEVRGREAFTLFQAISVGHASMSTIHAGSIEELLHRVENEPMNVPRVLFQGLDVVVFMVQTVVNGERVRRVRDITEVIEVERESGNLLTNHVFTWNPSGDFFHFNGRSFVVEKIARETGTNIDRLMDELKRRESYLKLMDKNNITYYKDVRRSITAYYTDPVSATIELERMRA